MVISQVYAAELTLETWQSMTSNLRIVLFHLLSAIVRIITARESLVSRMIMFVTSTMTVETTPMKLPAVIIILGSSSV